MIHFAVLALHPFPAARTSPSPPVASIHLDGGPLTLPTVGSVPGLSSQALMTTGYIESMYNAVMVAVTLTISSVTSSTVSLTSTLMTTEMR